MEEVTGEVKYSGLLLKSAIAVIIITVALVVLFPNQRLNLILILVGLLMGAYAAFYLYHSFSTPPRELIFPQDEEIIKKNVDGRIYITVPTNTGGFIPKTAPTLVNLYLTNYALVAEPTDLSTFDEEGRFYVFSIPLNTIVNFKPEKKLLAEYIRLSFTKSDGTIQEIILHTDTETQSWIEAISQIMS